MRNFKRTLALVLAVIMVMGTFATVSAASTDWYKEAVDYLEDCNIAVIGKTADQPITRNEFVLWVSKIESKQLSDNAWRDEVASAVFTDVNDNHNKAAIAYAHNAGYIIGNGDGTFAPDKTVSFAEASAVVVRLMGYESKVKGLAGAWDTNYILAASNYCRAFDQVFYKNVDTMNPDYELCKGEAAYILATVMNGINRNASNLILTADGIDLGAWFLANGGPVAKENVYYIASLDRASIGMASMMTYIGNTVDKNGDDTYTSSDDVAKHELVNAYPNTPVLTNIFNAASTVVLKSAENGNTINISGKEFLKALRVHLGMNPTPDTMNEEAEINVYDYVNIGTMVNVKIDTSKFVGGVATITNYKDIAGFEINTNSVVVDTFLQLGSVSADNANGASYIGWSVKELASKDAPTPFKPYMNAGYNASLATSWTNVVYDAVSGDVESAVLNFKGVAYVYGEDIVAYDKTWTEMTADEAVNTLINAAQGECYAVFNDIDEDGLYDTVYVADSYAFAYATEANVQPTGTSKDHASSGKYYFDILTSMSKGEIVANTTMAYNNIGSVIFNREVGYPNSGQIFSSDAFNLTAKNTGKLQLVLCGSNARPVLGNANCVPLYYTVVDLASFYTGIIEEVSANYVDGYYTARIRCTDDVTRTVYIPTTASATVELDVALEGATATYTFDSTAWFTFLEDTKDAAITEGIVQVPNVKDPNYLNWTAAWMAGKYVEFATNENNEVFCILGTDATTGTTGFVAGVEKTETGDNSYNVTIATSQTVNYASFTQYYNASHPITNAAIMAHSYQPNFGGNTINATSIVANDGNTYYKTDAASGQLWASTPTVTADTYYVCLDATTGKIYTDANGNYADSLGHVFMDYENLDTYNSVSGLKTVEVRAAASGIFDWANYNVYNQLFQGILLDPNVATDKKVEAGRDLIYVTLMQDAGSNYVLYNEYPATVSTSASGKTTQFQVGDKAYTGNRWYKQQIKSVFAAEASWYGIEDGYILSIAEVAGSRQDTYDGHGSANGGLGNVNGYTALYNAKVGFGPYYERAWNTTSKSYTYELRFTEVVELQNFIGTAEAIIDTTKTYMVALHENQADASSNQVIADTAEEKAMFTLANGFYVDKDGKVFIIISADIVYKTKDNGELVTTAVKYDYTTAQAQVVVGTDVSFEDTATLGLTEELAPYATLTISEKPRTAEGWFPGAYYITIDGVNYSVTTETDVVVVTPSAKGFNIVTKTVAQLLAEGSNWFVTEWNAVIGTGNTIETIAVVGQKAGSTKTPVNPEPPVDNNRLVFLDGTATAYIRHDQYSNTWLVVSDKSAYALPTGEEVGAIYRSYPTYADAENDITIDLSVEGGKWYIINEKNEIVGATDVTLLTGTITDTKADGTTIATMNGEKNVVISNMETEFFYFNAEKTSLYVADDKTDVTIIAKAAFESLFSTQVKAVETAQAAYDEALVKWNAGNLSDERLDYYRTNLENAKTALTNAKAESLDKYFNGQFWGFANSPLYQYVAMAQGTFQEGMPTLTFNYVIVDEVLCVFSDSFSFGA